MGVFRAHLHMWHRRKISQGPLGHSSAKPLGLLAGMASLTYAGKQRASFFFQFSIDFVCVCFGVMHVQVNRVCRGVRVQMCAFAGEGQRRTPVSFHPSTMWFETGSLIGLLLNRPDWLNSENPHTEYHAS